MPPERLDGGLAHAVAASCRRRLAQPPLEVADAHLCSVGVGVLAALIMEPRPDGPAFAGPGSGPRLPYLLPQKDKALRSPSLVNTPTAFNERQQRAPPPIEADRPT